MKRQHAAHSASLSLGVWICLAFVCALSASAHANTITVVNINDSGPGSLRQALADANDGDTIDFTVTGTIGLTSGELLVNKSVTVSGPGRDVLAVNGNATSRVFHITPGTVVAISDVTIANGYANTQPVPDGGGIDNDHATMTLTNCNIIGNVAFRDGGGVQNAGAATMTLNGCVIDGNSTGNQGGGICNNGTGGAAIMEINNSTVSNNSAYHGAGISNDGRLKGATLLQINNTTLNNNSAGEDAGAILNIADTKGTAILSNCTISGNVAQSYGGGINNVAGLTLSNTTFSGNSANLGGSIAIGNPVAVSLGNTVLNAGKTGGNIYDDGGTVMSRGYNLSSDDAGGYLNGPGDQINTEPMLGVLQDNGGPTLTHALLAGSPAIDAGDPTFTPPPDFDQRGPGFDRVVNNRIDIGSFEIQEATPTPTPTPTSTPCAVTSGICGTIVSTRPTDFLVNVNGPVDPPTVDASDFSVNGLPANSFALSNGNTTITFHFNSSPGVQGPNTIHIPAGAFNCGNGPVQEFNCTFFYQVPRLTPTPRPRPTPVPRL